MTVKGSMQVETDDLAVEAALVFYPDDTGDSWDALKVKKLLEEAGLTVTVEKEVLDEALSSLAVSSTIPARAPVLFGEAPQPPQEEAVEWQEYPIPEPLKKMAVAFFKKAPSPHITISHTEKKKVTQKVEKKTLFGKKEEEVETTERVEVNEEVKVNPKVILQGYAEQDAVLGELTPMEPGIPGKDLFGKMIPPPEQDDLGVLPGQNCTKKKNQIIADEDGFYRCGERWVEVFPLRAHHWSVKASADKATCYLNFSFGDQRYPLPQCREILAQCEELGFSAEVLLDEDSLNDLLLNHQKQERDLIDYSLSQDREGSFSIDYSPNKIKAYLSVHKGCGRGKSIDIKAVGQAVTDTKIPNMDLSRIKKDLKEFFKSSEMDLEQYVFAEGQEPERGSDRELKPAVTFKEEEEMEALRERLEKNPPPARGVPSINQFPLRDVEQMACVSEGDKIASLGSARKGKSGKDVFGNSVEGFLGNDPQLQIFENIEFQEDALIALKDGILDYAFDKGAYFLRVRFHKNAEVKARLSEDKMRAWVDISAPEGSGFPADREMIEDALAEAGIQEGIMEEALEELISMSSDREEILDFLIAKGKLPSHAMESHVLLHIDWDWSEPLPEKALIVEEGQLLLEILPETEEKVDGVDLTGRVLPAKEGVSFDFTLGENIRKEKEDDGRLLCYAEKKGEVEISPRGISVLTVREIEGNVSLRTGSIKFSGEVNVHGSVENGYYIMAGSSVRIGEIVNRALVSSDADIMIKQGVQGQGKAVLRARKSITLGFAEETHLMCVGDLVIKQRVLDSQIKCNGRIHGDKEKGRISGGEIKAKHGLSVFELGSENSKETKISFGQDYLVLDQIEVEEREIEKLRNTVEKIDGLLEKVDKTSQQDKLRALRQKKVKAFRLIEKRTMRIFNLRERFEEHFRGEIRVYGNLFPGVIIETHGRKLEIEKKYEDVSIVFNQENGKIEINRPDSINQPA